MQLVRDIGARLAELPSCKQVRKAFDIAISTEIDDNSDTRRFSAQMEVDGVEWRLDVADNKVLVDSSDSKKSSKTKQRNGGMVVKGDGVTVRLKRWKCRKDRTGKHLRGQR